MVCINCSELDGVTTPSLFLLLSMIYGVWGVDKIRLIFKSVDIV